MNLEQNVYVAHLNNVRKSWVSKTPDNIKEMFRAMPQAERFEHYKRIDEAVIEVREKVVADAHNSGKKLNEAEHKKIFDTAAQIVVNSLINGTFA